MHPRERVRPERVGGLLEGELCLDIESEITKKTSAGRHALHRSTLVPVGLMLNRL